MHPDGDAVRGDTISTSQKACLPKARDTRDFRAGVLVRSSELTHEQLASRRPAKRAVAIPRQPQAPKMGIGRWCWTLTEPLELALGTGRGWYALPPAGSVLGERSGVNLRTYQASSEQGEWAGLVGPDSCASPLLADKLWCDGNHGDPVQSVVE